MKVALTILFIIVAPCLVSSADPSVTDKQQESTGLEIVELGKPDEDESLDVQKKRESGYSYKKPARLPTNYRLTHRRRPRPKRPNQQTRPLNYRHNLPVKQSPFAPVVQQDFVPSVGAFQQEAPADTVTNFDDPNPIASQNNVPFGRNTALYLPPKNQRLPSFSTPAVFSPESPQHFLHNHASSQQISDAALFLAQNARAISKLYGAPASDQAHAPNDQRLFNQNTESPRQNDEESGSDSRLNNTPEDFSGSLPSYASGILSSREVLQKIQSLEKDRLILELQRALLQSRNAETGGYNRNTNAYLQDHGFEAALGSEGPEQNGLGYGIPTLGSAPSSSTSVPSSSPTNDSPDPSKPSISLLPPATADFPHFPGFIPSVISGPNILTGVPNFKPEYAGFAGQNVPVKPFNSPTHFGIPLPAGPDQTPNLLPDLTGVPHLNPLIPVRPTTPALPAPPVYPVSTPIQSVRPVYPISTPLRPVVPVNPVTPIQPAVTPIIAHSGHAFGIHPTNHFVYKQLKSIYPFYYSGQKAAAPVHPWAQPQKPVWN